MLSLVIVVIIVVNVVLWSYQMNQFDLERMHEDIKITDVANINNTVRFTFENQGSYTAHLVALWIDNSTTHQRHDMNLYVNSGDTVTYSRTDVNLPEKPYIVKIVTERGNTAVYSAS